MSGLLPSSPDVSVDHDPEPRVIGLDSEDASNMIAALSSDTARSVLSVLHDEPSTPSAVADRVDTSLQNVQYHLEKLEGADLVEPIGTRYSEKGREMTIYGPADGPLVVFPGSDEEVSGFKRLLRRMLGAVLVLGAASAIIEAVAREWIPGLGTEPATPGDDAVGVADDDAEAGPLVAEDTDDPAAEDDDSTDAADEDIRPSDDDPATADAIDMDPDPGPAVEDAHWVVEAVVELPPGLTFFLGGCLVLLVVAAFWYWRPTVER